MVTNDDSWLESWESFTQVLERRLQAHATSEDLLRWYGGKTVRWRGVISRLDIDNLAPNVYITLAETVIDLGGGRETLLDVVSLPIADSAIEDWRGFCVGAEVTFEATFLAHGDSPFPPIEVKTLKSGRTLVMLGLRDAAPIG